MSSMQTQKEINRIESEISKFNSELSKEQKKEADLIQKINRVVSSITKNTSVSQVQSKEREIQRHNSEIMRIKAKQSSITSKISAKQKRKSELFSRLQRELKSENTKNEKLRKQEMETFLRKLQPTQLDLNNIIQTPQGHLVTNLQEEFYDVFISHASEDKASFVQELVDELDLLNITCWYDDIQMQWGDSLRKSIDNGLKKSKYGIVVISKNYIAEGKYWTKEELEGLFQKESVQGKVILPIWHNISKAEVMEFSPLIAGKKALKTSDFTPNEIAMKLQGLLSV